MAIKDKEIISEILDKGLADSTFREKFPKAYDELLNYRRDMEEDVCRVMGWNTSRSMTNA